jgi:predicted alpha/beta-fold hydrolase
MFSPPALLAHRHLQSIVTQIPWRRARILKNASPLLDTARTELIDCGEGIRLQGFHSAPPGGSRGLVVLLHGWEGSAHSSYILSAGSMLFDAGFSVFRLNFRDHGETQSLNEGLFHSCRIDEVARAVMRVREMFPARHFAVVGQSLGGNFALRIAARAVRDGLDIGRVLAVCPVLKPHSTMLALDRGFWLYRRYFLARWRRSLLAKAQAFPDLYQFGDLRRFDTLTATTKFFVENYTEFESLDRYLDGYAIVGDALSAIETPGRILVAEDDPIIPVADLALIARPASLEVTALRHGGHCGFVDHLNGPSWIDREILRELDYALQ